MSNPPDSVPITDPTPRLLALMQEHPGLGLTDGHLFVLLLGTSSRFVPICETRAGLTWVSPHENLAWTRVAVPEPTP